MYYVNKIVGWCLSPLGVCLVLMLVGMFGRFGRFGRFCGVGLAFAWLWFFSCGFFTRWIGPPLEGNEIDVASLPSADAIVLLGGGMMCHERCGRAEICSGADRVWMAARLIKAGKAPLLTVSGGGASAEVALLRDLGVVDANKIVVLDMARNTEEEARFIAGAMGKVKRSGEGEQRNSSISSAGRQDENDKHHSSTLTFTSRPKVLLVTSAWHMPRAKMLFERAGFEVIPAPTDYEAHCASEAQLGIGDFFPNADALNRNSYLAKEWVARFCYALKR